MFTVCRGVLLPVRIVLSGRAHSKQFRNQCKHTHTGYPWLTAANLIRTQNSGSSPSSSTIRLCGHNGLYLSEIDVSGNWGFWKEIEANTNCPRFTSRCRRVNRLQSIRHKSLVLQQGGSRDMLQQPRAKLPKQEQTGEVGVKGKQPRGGESPSVRHCGDAEMKEEETADTECVNHQN